ncbi:hypothetical protein [Nocardia sp. NPDC004711]
MLIFVAATSVWFALSPATVYAAPSKDWCDSRQEELQNECLARFIDDSSKVVQCKKVVMDWYAKCLKGDIDTTSPCLCELLKPLGFDARVTGRPDDFNE